MWYIQIIGILLLIIGIASLGYAIKLVAGAKYPPIALAISFVIVGFVFLISGIAVVLIV